MLQIVNVPGRHAPTQSVTPDNTAHQEAMSAIFMNETYGNWSGIVVKLTVKNAHPILKGVSPLICPQHPKILSLKIMIVTHS